MINLKFIPLFIILFSTSCSSAPPPPAGNWQQISGRNDEYSNARPLLYRARIPPRWIRCDPEAGRSLMDTSLPVCEFYLEEKGNKIRVAFHTFPIIEEHRRIPPEAQVARWKKQFEELDPLSASTTPASHGGFHGLFFEGEGRIEGKPAAMLAWSMLLADNYVKQLNLSPASFDRLKRADYTIKAVGPPEFMRSCRSEILSFAQTFELIDELPFPS